MARGSTRYEATGAELLKDLNQLELPAARSFTSAAALGGVAAIATRRHAPLVRLRRLSPLAPLLLERPPRHVQLTCDALGVCLGLLQRRHLGASLHLGRLGRRLCRLAGALLQLRHQLLLRLLPLPRRVGLEQSRLRLLLRHLQLLRQLALLLLRLKPAQTGEPCGNTGLGFSHLKPSASTRA